MAASPALYAIRSAVPFSAGAIISAAIVAVPLELAARAGDLPSGIEQQQFPLFALQMMAFLLAGHLGSVMRRKGRGLPQLEARKAALAGFAAMALLLITLLLAGAPLGVVGRPVSAFVAGALATVAVMLNARHAKAAISG